MRYGILSDVHGNLEALTVVVEHLRGQGVDEFIFLGDAVGYGANPDQVCDVLRPLVTRAVLGNHDAAVSGRMDYSEYYDAARQVLDWCVTQLSDKNLRWLRSLPYKVRSGYVEFSHGAPLVPEMFDYLFAPEQLIDVMDAYDDFAPVTFIGHSHLTVSFRLDRSRVTPMIVPEIVCEPGSKFIITVGSVGQPRDRDPRASCGIFDTETRTFQFHRLEYDKERARQKIVDAGLAPVFGERLLVGM